MGCKSSNAAASVDRGSFDAPPASPTSAEMKELAAKRDRLLRRMQKISSSKTAYGLHDREILKLEGRRKHLETKKIKKQKIASVNRHDSEEHLKRSEILKRRRASLQSPSRKGKSRSLKDGKSRSLKDVMLNISSRKLQDKGDDEDFAMNNNERGTVECFFCNGTGVPECKENSSALFVPFCPVCKGQGHTSKLFSYLKLPSEYQGVVECMSCGRTRGKLYSATKVCDHFYCVSCLQAWLKLASGFCSACENELPTIRGEVSKEALDYLKKEGVCI